MLTRIRPTLGAALLVTGLLLTGCSAGEESLPDIDTAQERIADAESVVGYMTSADDEEVVLTMPDGSKRTFAVRPEDANRVGVDHLASHAGFTTIGFEVFYETEDGTDYILGAQETNPPRATAPSSSTSPAS